MKKKNILIVVLLLAGIIGMITVEGYIRPEMNRREKQYALEQREPLTNDFRNALKFKNRYIGNSSNFINLNYSLPLSDLGMTFQIVPDKLAGIINYKCDSASVEPSRLRMALVYNSTANFALIDNLKVFKMSFTDKTFTLSRENVEKWFGKKLSSLQDTAVWKKEVQDKLSDESYVDGFIKSCQGDGSVGNLD